MAFDVTGLTNYTKEESLNLLTKAMFTAKTARLLQGAGQVLPGIKSAEILPLLYSDVYFQSDSCSYQTSGNTTLSKRTLTVGKVKVQETLCPKDLETKYTQKALAAGEAIDMGVFTEQIGAEKAAKIAEAIETAIWQGVFKTFPVFMAYLNASFENLANCCLKFVLKCQPFTFF